MTSLRLSCIGLVCLLVACIPADAVIETGHEAFWRSEWKVAVQESVIENVALYPVVTDLSRPVSLTGTSENEPTLLIAEQAGTIQKVVEGSSEKKLVLDLSHKLSCCGEQGLLSIAAHPDFAKNQHLYAAYTDLDNSVVVARFDLSKRDPLQSETLIFKAAQPDVTHNGGQLKFGFDKRLYLSLGDGGYSDSPQETAQDPKEPLGKIIALNPTKENKRFEVIAMGLRNPWRFSFDRGTGDLYVADVGQQSFEEVNYLRAGETANFGWPILEGQACFLDAACDKDPYDMPIAGFSRDDTSGCSITGGYVYRGDSLPELYGAYLYGDFCSGKLWASWFDDSWQTALLFDTEFNISSFGENKAGDLYLFDYGLGVLYKFGRKDSP